ncbi:MAG: heme-copper oxidase subunit III [Gemmatimonadetes bacterium]|nr:heme-copper oxidase subunit III [Gemmatimonadota bacterium]
MVTEPVTYAMEQGPEPVRRPKLLADGVMGMLLFVFAEIMMFAGLISAHSIVRSRVAGEMWPPYGQPRLPVQETAVNTAALLVSGVVLVFAQVAFKKEASRARVPVLIALLLGLFFVGSQGAEWVALLGEGLTIKSSTYGGFFYLIVGAHGVHAIAAILALGWVWYELDKGRLDEVQLATVSVFWYFVVLLWPVLYLNVYL